LSLAGYIVRVHIHMNEGESKVLNQCDWLQTTMLNSSRPNLNGYKLQCLIVVDPI